MSIHAVIQKPLRITDPAIEEEIRTPLCFSESLGHFFGAAIMNEAGTGAADLTGASVTANFIRGDGIYGTVNGTVSGNVAYVVLPSWCYRATGRFTLTVFMNLGTASRAIIIARGRVMADTTDTAVDPEHIIPSIAELLAQISACISATEAANTAASNANTKAGLADTAASNANSKASAADTAAGAANTAASAANTAASNADAKAALANTAAGTANTAASNADAKAALANTAAGTANTAASNADTKAALANTAAGTANTAASNADAKATLANTAASNADTKAALANTAAETANSAASAANAAAAEIDDMTVAASGLAEGASPTATISEVSGHKHIAFGIPKGDKGDKGDPGQDGVVIDIGNDQFAFEIDANGDLILYYNAAAAPNFSINSSGDLIYTF